MLVAPTSDCLSASYVRLYRSADLPELPGLGLDLLDFDLGAFPLVDRLGRYIKLNTIAEQAAAITSEGREPNCIAVADNTIRPTKMAQVDPITPLKKRMGRLLYGL
jgi:hypothetical protein